jgi:hypothetical protein
VDENTGTLRVKGEQYRETDGDAVTAGPLAMYLAYTALRRDVSPDSTDFTLLSYGSTTTLADELGPLDTQNPLGFGMYIALLNATGFVVKGLGVSAASDTEPDGTLSAYVEAFEFLESKDVYAIVPLTHDSTVGQIAQAHVDAMSEPDQAMELITQCAKRFPGGQMFFDLPPTIVKKVAPKGIRASKHYRVPPMPFSLSINQLRDLVGRVPGLKGVRDVPMPAGRGFVFEKIFPTFWRLGPTKPFRGVYALLEFG